MDGFSLRIKDDIQLDWNYVRIRWSDSVKDNFDTSYSFPKMEFPGDKDKGNVITTGYEVDAPKLAGIDTHSDITGKNSIICDAISQWIVVEINPGAQAIENIEQNYGDPTLWPCVDVWAFLQPSTMTERWNNYVIDDHSRGGFFHAYIDPSEEANDEWDQYLYYSTAEKSSSDKATVLRSTDDKPSKNETIAYFRDIVEVDELGWNRKPNGNKIKVVCYKLKVTVRNEYTQKYQLQIVQDELQALKGKAWVESHKKNKTEEYTKALHDILDKKNLSSYIKIWARNRDRDWGPMCAIAPRNSNRDIMNYSDPDMEDTNNPRTYYNHTWKRDAITDKNGKLLAVGLLPPESIDLLKNLNKKKISSDAPQFDQRELNWGNWIFTTFGYAGFVFLITRLIDHIESRGENKKADWIYKTIKALGVSDLVAAHSVVGYKNGANITKTFNDAEDYDKANSAMTMFKFTRGIYSYLLDLACNKGDAQFQEYVDKIGKPVDVTTAKDLDISTEYKNGVKVSLPLAKAVYKKKIPKLGFTPAIPVLAWLNFVFVFQGSSALDFNLGAEFGQKCGDDDAKKGDALLPFIGIGGKQMLKFSAVARTIFEVLEDIVMNDTGMSKEKYKALEPIQFLFSLGRINASANIELNVDAEIILKWKLWLKKSANNPKQAIIEFNEFAPKLTASLVNDWDVTLSLWKFKHRLIEADPLVEITKTGGQLPGKISVAIPFIGEVASSKPSVQYFGGVMYGENTEMISQNKTKIIFGELFTFALPITMGLPEKAGEGTVQAVNNSPFGKHKKLTATINKAKGRLECTTCFSLSKTRTADKDVKVIEVGDSELNMADFFKHWDKSGMKLKPFVSPDGMSTDTSVDTHYIMPYPSVKTSMGNYNVDKRILTYYLDLQDYQDSFIYVRFYEIDTYSDDTMKYNSREWSIHNVTYADGNYSVGSIDIDVTKFTDLGDKEENYDTYKIQPEFSLTNLGSYTLGDRKKNHTTEIRVSHLNSITN